MERGDGHGRSICVAFAYVAAFGERGDARGGEEADGCWKRGEERDQGSLGQRVGHGEPPAQSFDVRLCLEFLHALLTAYGSERTEDRSTTVASLSTRPSNVSLGERSSHSLQSVQSNNSLLRRLNSADLNSLRTIRSQPGPIGSKIVIGDDRPSSAPADGVDHLAEAARSPYAKRVIVSTVDGPHTPPVTDEDARARFAVPLHQGEDGSDDSDAAAARQAKETRKEQRRQKRLRREARRQEDQRRAETMAEKSLRRNMAAKRKEEVRHLK